jgi:hypothetical protein
MMKKLFLFYTIIISGILLFITCDRIPVTGIRLNKENLILFPGETEKLFVILEPEKASNTNVISEFLTSEEIMMSPI